VSFLSILTGAASGGLLGLVGQLGVGALEEFRAGREHSRKLAEMRALQEMKVEDSAWRAFEASQAASKVPDNVSPWCANTITLVRPGLTVLFFGLAATAYFNAPDTVRADTLSEINACAFGLAYWWFGSRYQARLKK
jgi:hypothetical protein